MPFCKSRLRRASIKGWFSSTGVSISPGSIIVGVSLIALLNNSVSGIVTCSLNLEKLAFNSSTHSNSPKVALEILYLAM